jgi:uncharacterized protein YndB with AHSA1/START domain
MTDMATDQAVVRITRTISAPPAKVYRAWLDPEVLSKWFSAGSNSVARAEVDARVGGHHRIFQTGPDGDTGGFDSEFLELVPDRRIVLVWRFVGPDRLADPSHDSRLTVTFEEAPGGATELTLVHERLEAFAAAMPEAAKNVPVGWGQALDKLTELAGDL